MFEAQVKNNNSNRNKGRLMKASLFQWYLYMNNISLKYVLQIHTHKLTHTHIHTIANVLEFLTYSFGLKIWKKIIEKDVS